MVLFTILLLSVIVGVICFAIAAVVGGGVLIVMFGDVLVFALIVALIVKLVRRCTRTRNE